MYNFNYQLLLISFHLHCYLDLRSGIDLKQFYYLQLDHLPWVTSTIRSELLEHIMLSNNLNLNAKIEPQLEA